MILSHTKKFILLKTIKTGSTSTAVYFEKHCKPPSKQYTNYDQHNPPLVTDFGIISTRSKSLAKKYGWYIHTSPIFLRYFLREYWNSYFKFTTVRNTFDAVVSSWWFSWAAHQRNLDLNNIKFEKIRQLFTKALCENQFELRPNSQFYTIHNKISVDFFIRQEHLNKDIKDVCNILDIPFEMQNIKTFKDTFKKNKTHFSNYYTNETADIVYRDHKFEIDYFGYSL